MRVLTGGAISIDAALMLHSSVAAQRGAGPPCPPTFIGLASQGAFVITTSQGLILIDMLNSTEEARDILVPG